MLGDERRFILAFTSSKMQITYHQTMPIEGPRMEDIPEPMTHQEAWDIMEEALKDCESYEEAVRWLNANPDVKNSLSPFGLIQQFCGDIDIANTRN
jgi:hypothetical protein